MALFQKRNSLLQNIAFIALMSAINVLFVVLTSVMPLLLFLLVFLLPLSSVIVTILCKKRFYPIYAVVTLGLCILIGNSFGIFDTLVYVIPSLITGFVFGLFIEYQLPMIISIVINTILQFAVSLLTYFVLSKMVTNMDLMDALIAAFGLNEFEYKIAFALIFIYIIAQIQIVLTYIFVKISAKKMQIEVNLNIQYRFVLYLVMFLSSGLTILSHFLFADWAMVFAIIPLPIYVYQLTELILSNKKLNWILLAISHLAFIFLFAFLYQYIAKPNQLILIIVLFGLVTIIDIFSNYCSHKNINNIK